MYGMRRGKEWITAPKGDAVKGQMIPPVIAIDSDSSQAWVSESLDVAIERQQLLRMCWGLSTEVCAMRHEKD